jgi:hypothetical protein
LNPDLNTTGLTTVIFSFSRKYLVLIALVVLSVVSSVANNENPKKSALSEQQKSVITYFQEVALGFEFGNTTAVTRKWATDMKVFVAGAPNAESIKELNKIISEINTLANDGFKIAVVSNKEDSNLTLFFGSKAGYAELFPKEAHLLKGSSGLCTISWNSKNQIVRGHIFVKNENISVIEQRHVIREELTQALGFGKDSPRYMESIFQSSFTTPTEYSAIDKELIKLLYHPQMSTGLESGEVESVIARILLTAVQ